MKSQTSASSLPRGFISHSTMQHVQYFLLNTHTLILYFIPAFPEWVVIVGILRSCRHTCACMCVCTCIHTHTHSRTIEFTAVLCYFYPQLSNRASFKGKWGEGWDLPFPWRYLLPLIVLSRALYNLQNLVLPFTSPHPPTKKKKANELHVTNKKRTCLS